MKLYKFLHDRDGTPTHGHGNWSMPRNGLPGKWRRETGPLRLCERGTLHYCEPDQLAVWIAAVLVEVEVRGKTKRDNDKCGALEMRVLRVLHKWDEKTQRIFAAACAYGALMAERKRGREPHPDSWNAVAVAYRYAHGDATPNELGRAERAATLARSALAARASATVAASDAVRAAATAAEWVVTAAATARAAPSPSARTVQAERVKQSRYLLKLCGETL